jgi:translation initiation factor IF-2
MEESRKTMLPIEYYSVIYDVIDKIDDMLKQILSPTPDGEFAGSAIIKQVRQYGFNIDIDIRYRYTYIHI